MPAVIGVDTGLSHLANALNVPLVAIYTDTDPGKTGVVETPGPPIWAISASARRWMRCIRHCWRARTCNELAARAVLAVVVGCHAADSPLSEKTCAQGPGLSAALGRTFRPPGCQATGAIWIHAVSVGETRAALPLIQAIRQRWPDAPLLLTQMTPTGRDTACQLYPDAEVRYLPYDYPGAVRDFLAVAATLWRADGNRAMAESAACGTPARRAGISGQCAAVGKIAARLSPHSGPDWPGLA
jgi:hypothetical protein